jgi:outer membrane protein OmpA-like peptidoglycan-associated protein
MHGHDAREGEETQVLDHVRLTVAVLLAMLLLLLWWRGHGPFSAAACCAGGQGAEVSMSATAPAPTAGTAPAAEPPPAGVAIESTVSAPPPAAIAIEPAVVSEPPYTVSDANAQVRTNPLQLPRWEGWQPPDYAHQVYVPPERPAPSETAAEPVATDAVPPLDEPAPAVATAAPESGATTTTMDAAEVGESPMEIAAAAPTGETDEVTEASPAYTIADPNAQVRAAESTLPAWTGPTYPVLQHQVYYPPAPPPAIETAQEVSASVSTAAVPPAAKLYFETAKWDLPADAADRLAPIVRYLNDHPAARAVIQGFHDPRGSQELNVTLAKNRAGATWNALVSAGIARERIILRQPLDSTGSGSLAEARRAEVSIQAE